jgi:hypothetical protein
MQIKFNVPCFKVPGNKGTVVATSINELINSVIGDTHNIICVTLLLISRKYFIALDYIIFLICPDIDVFVPTDSYNMCYFIFLIRVESTSNASDFR